MFENTCFRALKDVSFLQKQFSNQVQHQAMTNLREILLPKFHQLKGTRCGASPKGMIPLNKLLCLWLPYLTITRQLRTATCRQIELKQKWTGCARQSINLKLSEKWTGTPVKGISGDIAKPNFLGWHSSVWQCPLLREGHSDSSGDDCLFSDCNLHGSFFVLSLPSMQGALRGSRHTVPHAMPRGGIRSKQTYGQRLATLIRVSARVLISWQAGEDSERWKEWVAGM